MLQQLRKFAQSILYKWTDFVAHAPVLVIILSLAITVIALDYTRNNLGMNTSTTDMLSPDLPWRQLDLEYERNFPRSSNNLLVVIEANTPDQALDGADLFYRAILQETGLFKTVYYPNALSIFKESGLLFLDVDELQDLADRLAEIQPFLSRLTEDQSLRGLFSMLSEALDAKEDGEEIDLKAILTQINLALDAAQNKQSFQMSWHKLMSGQDDTDQVYREFIVLQPLLDYSSLLPAESAMQRLHTLTEELGIEKNIGARIRLTGSVALLHKETPVGMHSLRHHSLRC